MFKSQISALGYSAALLLVVADDGVIAEDINIDQVNKTDGKL